jgi:hypothetical protein
MAQTLVSLIFGVGFEERKGVAFPGWRVSFQGQQRADSKQHSCKSSQKFLQSGENGSISPRIVRNRPILSGFRAMQIGNIRMQFENMHMQVDNVRLQFVDRNDPLTSILVEVESASVQFGSEREQAAGD